MNKGIELLAPAGDIERLDYAILYGADAVYLSLKDFGMRAGAPNFDVDDFKSAVSRAHKNNVKVYVTCNILPTNSQIDNIEEYLKIVSDAKIDGLIIADIGVLFAAKKYAPDIEIHISTQAGIVNYMSAQEFYNMGAKRVVLARELSLEDIKVIRDKTNHDLELEVFVHGAMCVSFSGRCLLSSFLTGRDANRGQCAQPCRWSYRLVEESRPGQYFPIFEDQGGTYILNAKDLCMIEHIDKLAECGVDSLKIEGRAKSFYYVAVITNAYRQAIDLYYKDKNNYKIPDWLLREVENVSHREYSTGFYFGKPNNGQFYKSGGYVRSCEVMATIDRSDEKFLYCTQRNKFQIGDELEVISPSSSPEKIKVDDIFDENDEPIQSVSHAMMKFKISNKFAKIYPSGSIIRAMKI